MTGTSTIDTNGNPKLEVLLPGWADEASRLPHPAPLIEPVEVAVGNALGFSYKRYSSIPGALCFWNASNADASVPEHLVCADPVHLIAGSDDAQLVPIERLNLTIEETGLFIAELNEALGDSTGTFLHDMAGQWYYSGLIPDELDTAPTTAVAGHPMTAALPRDNGARPWRSLWSETQMVLHGSAVNQARQERGEPVINSVWFWGGGAMPTAQTAESLTVNRALYTDYRFAQKLADAAGIRHFPLSACEGLNVAESGFQQHLILDRSLLHGNPDFVEQRDLGVRWCERIAEMTSALPEASAELNGLTGCREVFVPAAVKSPSVIKQLAKLFKR